MDYQKNIMTALNGRKRIRIFSPSQEERPSWSSFNPVNPGSDNLIYLFKNQDMIKDDVERYRQEYKKNTREAINFFNISS
jgi:hypothetical protein